MRLPALAMLVTFLAVSAFAAQDRTVHVVFEPRRVYQVSSKTEGAWSTCRYCQSKVRYERTWRRDMTSGAWIETTARIPDVCRSCERKERELDRYAAEEARLDLKLAKKDAKARLRAKREILSAR